MARAADHEFGLIENAQRRLRQAVAAVLADAEDREPRRCRRAGQRISHRPRHAHAHPRSRRHGRSLRTGGGARPATPISTRSCPWPGAPATRARRRCRPASAALAASKAWPAGSPSSGLRRRSMPLTRLLRSCRATPPPPARVSACRCSGCAGRPGSPRQVIAGSRLRRWRMPRRRSEPRRATCS